MTCIHGFEEDCPICRITNSSIPEKAINQINKNFDLKFPQIVKRTVKKERFDDFLSPSFNHLKRAPFNIIKNPNLLKKLPEFKNKMFSERLSELDLMKSDKYHMLKRISLISPELNLEEEK